MKRAVDWATLFHQFLLDKSDVLFEWGTQDCCLWPANAIESFTSTDIAADFRGRYVDEVSAFAAIKAVTGGKTVADAAAYCAAKYGLVELTHPLCAQRGDLVVMSNGDNLIAGIVHLNGRHVVTVGEGGLVRLPITAVTRAWRV